MSYSPDGCLPGFADGPDDIDLWSCELDDTLEPTLLARYAHLLTAAERDRGQRYHFERDRLRHLVTRALQRVVLADYAGMPPADLVFQEGPFGRPSLVAAGSAAHPPHFNISHSERLIVMAVRRRAPVGVDTEATRRMEERDAIAQRYFTVVEKRALSSLPADERAARFADLWTLKESYLKCKGTGLSAALDEAEFDLAVSGRIGAALKTGGAMRWSFWQVAVAPGQATSVCALDASPHAAVRLWRTIPLLRSRPAPCHILRTTSTAQLHERRTS